jgi:hypothetical protein
MNERSLPCGQSPPNNSRHTVSWLRATLHSIALSILLLCTCACPPKAPSVPPIIQRSSPASPVSLSFSQISDNALAVTLATTARPGPTTVDIRNLLTQSISSTTVDTSTAGSTGAHFVLPTPWNGELKITSPGRDRATESIFVAIVIEPVLPDTDDRPARIIYGPSGRSSVRFEKGNSPPAGTQIFFTSPVNAISPPVGLDGDLVNIGLIPSPPKAATGVIGLTPWSPSDSRLSVHVYDPNNRQWSALPSRPGRDGTVFATGPVPGLYALAVGP